MTSTSIKREGIAIHYTNENGKVYRVTMTDGGNQLNKSHVFGIGKAPYIKAYNRKFNIAADEVELLTQVIL